MSFAAICFPRGLRDRAPSLRELWADPLKLVEFLDTDSLPVCQSFTRYRYGRALPPEQLTPEERAGQLWDSYKQRRGAEFDRTASFPFKPTTNTQMVQMGLRDLGFKRGKVADNIKAALVLRPDIFTAPQTPEELQEELRKLREAVSQARTEELRAEHNRHEASRASQAA